MSSVVAICQTDAIHLVTDGALYDDDGTVVGFNSKVIPLHLANSVLALRGASWAAAPLELILGAASSFDQAIERLPDLMERMIVQFNEKLGPDVSWVDRDFEVTIAGWSSKYGRFVVAVASSFAPDDPNDTTSDSHQPGYQQFIPREAPRAYTAPLIDVQGVLGREIATMGDVNELNGEVDGLALHCAQRVTPGIYCGKPRHLIGGFAELTTITRDGLKSKILREWPDAVGKKIAPEGGVPIALLEQAMTTLAAAEEAARALQEACLSSQIMAVPPVLDVAA